VRAAPLGPASATVSARCAAIAWTKRLATCCPARTGEAFPSLDDALHFVISLPQDQPWMTPGEEMSL